MWLIEVLKAFISSHWIKSMYSKASEQYLTKVTLRVVSTLNPFFAAPLRKFNNL